MAYIKDFYFLNYSVSLGYFKNTLEENEFDAWDRSEEDCREDEWCIWCRAQGLFPLHLFFVSD